MGIALCHFALGAEEKGIEAAFVRENPAIETEEGMEYVASYRIGMPAGAEE